MFRLITSFFFMTALAVSQVPANINMKYSYGSFAGKSFTAAAAGEFNGQVIYKSVFAQENPDTPVFPPGVSGLLLVCVNVDNVLIPAGVTVNNRGGACGSSRRYKVQNDGRDWIVDGSNRPVRLVNEESEQASGRSIDKADIPTDEYITTIRNACLTRASGQYEIQRCQSKRLDPEDMQLDRVTERRSREGVIR